MVQYPIIAYLDLGHGTCGSGLEKCVALRCLDREGQTLFMATVYFALAFKKLRFRWVLRLLRDPKYLVTLGTVILWYA